MSNEKEEKKKLENDDEKSTNQRSLFSYTGSKYLSIVYFLIGAHFLSGIAISDRRFRHALGFLPHIIGLCYTAFLFYSNILNQLIPWIKVRNRIFTFEFSSLLFFVFSFRFESSRTHWEQSPFFSLSVVYTHPVFRSGQFFVELQRISTFSTLFSTVSFFGGQTTKRNFSIRSFGHFFFVFTPSFVFLFPEDFLWICFSFCPLEQRCI